MIDINLLPWRMYAKERKKYIFKLVCLTGLFLLGGIFYVISLMPTSQIKKTQPVIQKSIVPLTLQTVPLQHIRFQGFIQQYHRAWGIVMLPNHTTDIVEVGSLIGREKARVLNISDQGMTVATSSGNKLFYR